MGETEEPNVHGKDWDWPLKKPHLSIGFRDGQVSF